MPAEIRARIEAAAQRHGRSMNAEIVARLEHSLEEDRKRELSEDLDPFQVIVQATEGIGRMAALINKSLIPLGVETRRIQTEAAQAAESRGDYGTALDLLPADERQVIEALRRLPAEARQSIERLLHMLESGASASDEHQTVD